jgi:trk system potassium uptake protein TrkH
MRIAYKNKTIEKTLTIVKAVTSAMVVASFVILFGFEKPFVPLPILFGFQIGALCIFLVGKVIRFFNAESKKEYLLANWFEIPMLTALGIAVLGSGRWFSETEPDRVRHLAVGIYLIVEVVVKVCITSVSLAASGKNPTQTLVASFVVLIVTGGGLLMLPRASTAEPLSLVDALFTATSATCVTGLVVRDTGRDFTFMGQLVILILIQLGGLGIVVFGAVFALLLGQAFSIRESVAMQDVLSAQTLSRIGNMILFIFVATVVIEAIGAVLLYPMWAKVPGWQGDAQTQWFCSIFHSISAFCNAGFGLFDDSLIRYNRQWQVYAVICPLIVLGGLGFGVLYNLANIAGNRTLRFFKTHLGKPHRLQMEVPKRMRLQAKVALSVSGLLIVFGMLTILVFERYAGDPFTGQRLDVLGALFQSVTARTAGFNTIDVATMTPSSKIVLMMLMFVGGSPGSSAGGIKTVTLAVIVMTVSPPCASAGRARCFDAAGGSSWSGAPSRSPCCSSSSCS